MTLSSVPAAEPGRVVALGDSLTAGYGLPSVQAYPALLAQRIAAARLPFAVINAGASGDTTADGLRRLDRVLPPDTRVLIIALGGNDGLRQVPAPRIEANLRAIVHRARERAPGVRIILAGLRMPAKLGATYAREFAAVFPRVARDEGVVLLPHLLEKVGGVASLNQDDTIHPNAEGQRRIADTVWAVLEPVLRSAGR